MRIFSSFGGAKNLAGLLAAATIGSVSPQANALVISGAANAFGVSVDVGLTLPLATLGVAVTDSDVTYTAPPPGSATASDVVAGVTTPVGSVSTFLFTVNASSTVDGAPGSREAKADATVNGLSVGVGPVGTLLDLTSTVITSNANVTGDYSAFTATGTSILAGAFLSVLGGAAIDLGVAAAAGPNTTISVPVGLGLITIVLNEQVVGGDGVGSRSLIVNAIHISFDDVLLGLGLLDGDIIVAHSEASLNAVPNAVPLPSTLFIFVAGLMMLWFVRRRMSLPMASGRRPR